MRLTREEIDFQNADMQHRIMLDAFRDLLTDREFRQKMRDLLPPGVSARLDPLP